jgi:hypothetical protein
VYLSLSLMCFTFRALLRFINYIKIPTNALGFMDIILITTIQPNEFVGLLIYFMTPTNVLLSKGAGYHSSGYTNSRNNKYWYTKTSHFNPRRAIKHR